MVWLFNDAITQQKTIKVRGATFLPIYFVDLVLGQNLDPQAAFLIINAATKERCWSRECQPLVNFINAAVTMTEYRGEMKVLYDQAVIPFTQTAFLLVYMWETVLLSLSLEA